jgi:uncharacterized membrane protein YedE/YeeE
MLLWNGRVAGISGIISGMFSANKSDWSWRIFFIAGLFAGGAVLQFFEPPGTKQIPILTPAQNSSIWITLIAGLLVGVGTVLANGCTSGHGVCGVSRLSPRSIVATLSFIFAGAVVVFFIRQLG